MSGWDEAWLKGHQARMASSRTPPVRSTSGAGKSVLLSSEPLTTNALRVGDNQANPLSSAVSIPKPAGQVGSACEALSATDGVEAGSSPEMGTLAAEGREHVRGRAAVAFTLSRPTPLLNELLRMQRHWAIRRKHCWALSAEIAALLGVRLASPPIEHAIITVTRYSVGTPDADALTAKSLLDTLQPRSERHPYGLGVIAGDDPAHLTLHLSAALCHKRKEQRTEVQIVAIG
jgi:hypothetical protein